MLAVFPDMDMMLPNYTVAAYREDLLLRVPASWTTVAPTPVGNGAAIDVEEESPEDPQVFKSPYFSELDQEGKRVSVLDRWNGKVHFIAIKTKDGQVAQSRADAFGDIYKTVKVLISFAKGLTAGTLHRITVKTELEKLKNEKKVKTEKPKTEKPKSEKAEPVKRKAEKPADAAPKKKADRPADQARAPPKRPAQVEVSDPRRSEPSASSGLQTLFSDDDLPSTP